MTAAKIIIGIMFVVIATVVYGDAHDDKYCAVFYPGDSSWWGNAPENCRTWVDCDTSDQDGRCTGYVRVEIDDISTTYAVMSCKTEKAYNVYKCKDFNGVKCVDNGSTLCLEYRVYPFADCTESRGFPSVVRTQSTHKCYSDTPWG